MIKVRLNGEKLGAVCSYLPIIAFGIFVALCMGFVYKNMEASSACLQAGYPQGKLDWKFKTYCVKRQDQTDIVVPLSGRPAVMP